MVICSRQLQSQVRSTHAVSTAEWSYQRLQTFLHGAIDMVASARGASIATADRTAAVPAMKSRSLGIRSSLTLRKRGDYAVRGIARYWDNPSAEAGRHPRQGGFVNADLVKCHAEPAGALS
jgi:hypothetical protein